MNIKIGNEYISNIIGFELTRTHGLSEIISKGHTTTYKGFFNGNYFIIETNAEYGFDCELLEYRELYNDVIVNDEFDELINFINSKETLKAYNKKTICNYNRINNNKLKREVI